LKHLACTRFHGESIVGDGIDPSDWQGTAPSKANEAAFQRAVTEVAESATVLIRSLTTTSTPRDREAEAVKARARSAMRFGRGRPD
jgi:Uncharacterized conserved protein (DUF2277)